MKQGINIHMPVKFSGVDLDDVTRIDFLFKPRDDKDAPSLKRSTYKSDGTGDAQLKPDTDDTILVPWTAAETYKVEAGAFFYLDTLITLDASSDNPQTNMVRLRMDATLFEESDAQ